MSGCGRGVYLRIEEEANVLRRDPHTYRRAFATHLDSIAEALRLIEWVDGCDESPGAEKDAILACICPNLMFTTLIKEAVQIRDELTFILKKVKK